MVPLGGFPGPLFGSVAADSPGNPSRVLIEQFPGPTTEVFGRLDIGVPVGHVTHAAVGN